MVRTLQNNGRVFPSRLSSLVALCGSLVAGCVSPAPPPAMSFAKFVRTPPGGHQDGAMRDAKVGFSTGAMLLADDEQGNLYFFPAEGSITFPFQKGAVVAMSAGNMKGSAEVCLDLLTTETPRLALLLGAGVGHVRELWEEEPESFGEDDQTEEQLASFTFFDISAGMFAQLATGPNSAAFAGLKYTFASGSESNTDDELEDTNYYTASLGFSQRTDSLLVSPELLVSYATWEHRGYEQSSDEEFWVVLLGITTAAPF